MLFQPEEDILLIAGSGAVPHVPAAVFKSGGIISRRHIPVPGNGTEVDLQFVCSTGFGESHGFEFLNFVIHVPVILHSLRESLLSYGSYGFGRGRINIAFEAQNTRLIKSGNRFLKYYLGEAALSLVKCDTEYKNFYHLKYKEVNKYQHKRALALTARKFVRLIFRLLKDNRLYIPSEQR